MNKRILAPHKDQDGYVYLRVRKLGGSKFKSSRTIGGVLSGLVDALFYHDNRPDQRIISSKRVEEAVETYDYLKRCTEEGLWVDVAPNIGGDVAWAVYRWIAPCKKEVGFGATLREAYYRHYARVGQS